jgi:hypothetical protein
VHDCLQEFGAGVGDFARQKQVVEHEQIWFQVGLNNLLLFARIAKCEAGQFAVGFDLANL